MDKESLTPRRLAVLKFIGQMIAQTGCAPSMDEIADEFAVSSPMALKYVNALVKLRYCKPARGKARSTKITAAGEKILIEGVNERLIDSQLSNTEPNDRIWSG